MKEEHALSLNEDPDESYRSARSMTPTLPDFEELSADESDSDLDLQSRFEGLPTEVILCAYLTSPNANECTR